MEFELVVNNSVSLTDDANPRFKEVGKIVSIEESKGFKKSYQYWIVKVKFPDGSTENCLHWELKVA